MTLPQVRVSFYKEDVEVGFLNFVNPSGVTKTDFFNQENLVGSAWTDMDTYTTTVSLDG